MKVSGFTLVRNAEILDFPVEASIRSILPVCDEVVVNIGKSDDRTLAIVRAIQALPIETTIYPAYYLDGDLAHELRDLLAMIHHAVLRGATRVRLLIR